MPSVVTQIPAYSTTPYLTVAELKRNPIYTQLQKLVPGGSDADNDAELARIIMRVSAMINGECRQNLSATVDTEAGWVTLSDYGELRIHTRNHPVRQVLSVSVGTDPYNTTAISDLSQTLFDPWRITIPARALTGSSIGFEPMLSLSGYRPGRRVWAQWSYVNGFPVTTLSAPALAGATSMIVADATGILVDQTTLTVQDGKWLEHITPTALSGNTLTVAPLTYAHQAGVGVNALPDDIQEAALFLISRVHDSWSMSMGAITHDGTGARKPGSTAGTGVRSLCDPGVILAPYKRVW